MVRTTSQVATAILLVLLLGSTTFFSSGLATFANPPVVRGFRPVGTDSLGVFFDALLRLPRSIVSFFMEDASAANRFLVLAPPCNTAQINLDANCWSATSGGVGGAGIPGSGDAAILDAASGAGAGTINLVTAGAGTCTDIGIIRCFRVNSWVAAGFTGTIIVTTSNADLTEWQINGAFTLGGTLTLPATATDPFQLVWRVGGASDFRVGTFNRGNAIHIVSLGSSANFFTGEKLFPELFMGGASTTTGNVNADTVHILGNLGTYAVKARHLIGLGFTMGSISGIGTNVPWDWTAATGGTVNLTQWVTNDDTLGAEDYRWVQDTAPITTTVTFVFDCLASNGDYFLERNSAVVGSQNAGSASCFGPQSGRVSMPVTGGWGAGDVMTLLSAALFVAPGGPGAALGPHVAVVCGNVVSFADTSPQASSAILYQWSFGDGTVATTSSGNTTHTYPGPGTYNGTVAVQYRNGAIQQYSFTVTTGTCDPLALLATYFLDFVAILVLAIAVLLIAFRRSKHQRLKRWATIILIAGLVILAAAFIFFGRLPFT